MVMPTRPVSVRPPAPLRDAALAIKEPIAKYKAYKAVLIGESNDLSSLADRLRALRNLLTWAENEYQRRQKAIRTFTDDGYNQSCVKEADLKGLTLVEANILVWVATSPKFYEQELKEIADTLYEIEGGQRDDTESSRDVPKTSTGEAW